MPIREGRPVTRGLAAVAAIVASIASFVRPVAGETLSAETMVLTGIVRDFEERTWPNGHPDFVAPGQGVDHVTGHVSPFLGPGGKPVLIERPSRGASPIRNPMSASRPGERKGTGRVGITSAASFAQWYRDVPDVNLSAPLALSFIGRPDGRYVFDDRLDPLYAGLGGFFPIEHRLFGNPGGAPDRNFHFTVELHADFTYDASARQVFRVSGDDDVMVFVDGRMVIDLAGADRPAEESLDLNRLALADGRTYTLSLFYAERNGIDPGVRIETNLPLRQSRPSATMTTVSSAR